MIQRKNNYEILTKNALPLLALTLAAFTCCFVPFDAAYGDYFDLSTLSCLFCTMAVVGAFKNIRFFETLSHAIVARIGNTRRAVLALVFVTYFGSMILANDMALITFLPLGSFVLGTGKRRKYLAFCFVMQNVAANLGGMLTPFGNPQNLYLFSYYGISTAEFFSAMAIPFGVALLLIVGVCLFVKPDPIEPQESTAEHICAWRTAVYAVLFALSVLIVFRVFPYYWGLPAIVVSLVLLDPRSFLRVDYGLLLTFCAFFVFSSNLARIDAVHELLGSFVNASPLVVGVLSCQVISNVPSAVLLSHFTHDWQSLLVAVNIGGLGTPIASLASLITLTEYRRIEPQKTTRYLGLFSAISFAFLAILLIVGLLFVPLFRL